MGEFGNRGNSRFGGGGGDRRGGGGSGGPRRDFGGGGRSGGGGGARPFQSGPRQLFDATCTKCGNPCKVPFSPTPGKQVLCDECFRKDRDENPRPPRRFA